MRVELLTHLLTVGTWKSSNKFSSEQLLKRTSTQSKDETRGDDGYVKVERSLLLSIFSFPPFKDILSFLLAFSSFVCCSVCAKSKWYVNTVWKKGGRERNFCGRPTKLERMGCDFLFFFLVPLKAKKVMLLQFPKDKWKVFLLLLPRFSPNWKMKNFFFSS